MRRDDAANRWRAKPASRTIGSFKSLHPKMSGAGHGTALHLIDAINFGRSSKRGPGFGPKSKRNLSTLHPAPRCSETSFRLILHGATPTLDHIFFLCCRTPTYPPLLIPCIRMARRCLCYVHILSFPICVGLAWHWFVFSVARAAERSRCSDTSPVDPLWEASAANILGSLVRAAHLSKFFLLSV